MTDHVEKWDLEIRPKSSLFQIDINELIQNWDLIIMFVKRDFSTFYKQTILGPLWFFIQPVLTSFMFTIIFGKFGNISTDGTPKFLYYLAGITLWNYFQDCVINTSDTFIKNANIFGKVYFPRLVVPISVVISNLIKFGVQIILFLAVYFYSFFTIKGIHPNINLLFLPVLVFNMALLGLGVGMVISALTTKYRDLKFLVTFGVQLLMYATPGVIIPLSQFPEKYRWFTELNPMTAIIATFKYGFLGVGTYSITSLMISCLVSVGILIIGVLTFNKVEKTFMDTV